MKSNNLLHLLSQIKQLQLNHLLVGVILTFIFFNYLFGFDKLNPSNLDWLFRSDTKKHLLGWLFYQQTELFRLPLGEVKNYGGYAWSNIAFLDTIPLLSLIFKYIPAFPSPGQYFGLWILICLVLQFYFSFKLLCIFSKKLNAALFFSLIFTLSPIMLGRSGFLDEFMAHMALMAHWLIIASFYLYFHHQEKNFLWLIILAISLLTHLYILAVIIPIYIINFISREKFSSKDILVFILPFLILILISYIIGYFVFDIEYSLYGFGRYRANLLALIDSNQWSLFLKDIPTSKNGEHEGFAYLGLSVIIILTISLFNLKKFELKKNNKRNIFFLILVILFFIFSISNNIYFTKYMLLKYDVYYFEKFFNIFRSSGRFIWPVVYSLLLFCFIFLEKLKLKNFSKICFIFLIIHVIDLSPALNKIANVKSESKNLIHFNDELISITKKFKNIYVVGKSLTPDLVADIGFLAIKNKQNLKPAFIFRRSNIFLEIEKADTLKDLNNGIFKKDTIYFFEQKKEWQMIKNKNFSNLNFLNIDTYYLAFTSS